MNWIRSRIVASPRPALVLGKAIFLAGALLIVAALFGRIGMIGANAERAKAGLPSLARLVELYPQHPTWLVPEGPVGYSVAALLVLAGMALVVVASDALKRSGPGGNPPW
ncbi:MAG: hypothetical protein JWP65_1050 [Ramlibacter sp.]|jgi:hypothetical protein|uniref:hypothetical protein n=1 Tax=Ramlibacter sp. TaxID=1917967 RepID=UPI002633E77E|nr:hypothetical protein [Ramlibacter sp.]MDB5750629.1 hypothetical protein [Ramlibacter sp.]